MCMTSSSKSNRQGHMIVFNIFGKRCLTLIFKVNHQGQVNDLRIFELLDIVNVRIDTKIKSASCIQPELRKVIQ